MKTVARMLVLTAAFSMGVQSFNLPAPPTPIPSFNLPAPPTPIPNAQIK
ncbi:MAG TPA: hypothetical protein VN669_11785 [Candidatus Acidoferrales bacterium]|nr:hypothetical protein [Candidatus Angelobacter sp.]HWG50369.1 hypothetical protein [Candidatus Acidoferrales bacterium]